jgi:hypothetical protein
MARKAVRAREMVTCEFCGSRTPARSKYTYRKVTGFVRTLNAAGVTLRRPLDVFACSRCVMKMERGEETAQLVIEIPAEQLTIA